MKKETELLHAAERGNVTKLECLFEQKQSKVFAGLFKGPNINWRNSNGCTALHLAALHGHEEVVIFLLHNDASANTPDNAGSFPLHLAAFNGHAGVARILIERGPSKARVNEQNMTGDTALHVAAQYNHHIVMDVLLKHHADIFLRNVKDETALDLAAQYGKFSAVQMLIFKDLTILKQPQLKHTPLHLATRNGHLKVVRLLLDSGMAINAICEMGTALHSAAFFGKVKVAKFLLKRGIDIKIKNHNQETVLDLLCKTPSQISQKITALIYEHSGLESDDNISDISAYSGPESISSNKGQLSSYDYVPSLRKASDNESSTGKYPYVMVEGLGNIGDRLSNCSERFDIASLTGKKGSADSNNNIPGDKKFASCVEENIDEHSLDMLNTDRDRQFAQLNISCSKKEAKPNNVTSSVYDVPPTFKSKPKSSTTNLVPGSNDNEYTSIIIDNKQQAMLTDAANNLLGIKSLSKSVPINIDLQAFHINAYDDGLSSSNLYDDNTLKNTPISSYDNLNLCSTLKQNIPVDIHECYDNVNLSAGKVQSSYDNVHLKNIPTSKNCEINPNKKNDKSLKQKRTVVKMDVYSDGDVSLSTKVGHIYNTDKPAKSSQIENISTNPLPNESFNKSGMSFPHREDNQVPLQQRKVKQSHTSIRSVQQGYRMTKIGNAPLDESYEWNKIDKFVSELELFAEERNIKEDEMEDSNIDEVSAWLNSLGLCQYQPIFLSNGFDDISFLNGVLNEQDLVELGIVDSDHRKIIIDASLSLPKSPVIGDEDFPFPQNITEWLGKLKLQDYERRFIHYGYDNMERIRVIWELELVTVLEITTIGHYKRMLSSLGKPTFRMKGAVLLDQNIPCNEERKAPSFVDDSMDVANQLWETAESLRVERQQRQSVSLKKSNDIISNQSLLDKKEEHQDSLPVLHNKENSLKAEWIHQTDTLVNGSVCYTMEYLGSHPVYEVKGMTSTHNACSKMKTISRNIHKMPSVTLSISIKGIDYIDSNSKMIISQYDINNISFCAQDPDDLNVFAYITRDEVTQKHYCHVFKVASVELADEVIITIGQCFQLAYKSYLDTMSSLQGPSIQTSSSANKTQNTGRMPSKAKPYFGESI